MLGYVNSKMLDRLIALNVTHFSIAKNYDTPHQHEISSVHFFTDNVPDANGGYPEVAYVIPAMCSSIVKNSLQGFNEVKRSNSVDVGIISYGYVDLSEYREWVNTNGIY
jgi:hypothetical protein